MILPIVGLHISDYNRPTERVARRSAARNSTYGHRTMHPNEIGDGHGDDELRLPVSRPDTEHIPLRRENCNVAGQISDA